SGARGPRLPPRARGHRRRPGRRAAGGVAGQAAVPGDGGRPSPPPAPRALLGARPSRAGGAAPDRSPGDAAAAGAPSARRRGRPARGPAQARARGDPGRSPAGARHPRQLPERVGGLRRAPPPVPVRLRRSADEQPPRGVRPGPDPLPAAAPGAGAHRPGRARRGRHVAGAGGRAGRYRRRDGLRRPARAPPAWHDPPCGGAMSEEEGTTAAGARPKEDVLDEEGGSFFADEQAAMEALFGRAENKKGALRRGFRLMPRVLRYLKPYKTFAVISVVLTILAALVALAQPWPLAFVVDSVIGDKPAPGWVSAILGSSIGAYIGLAVGATLLLTLLSGGMEIWNEYLSTSIDQRMVLDFRSDMFRHAQTLPLSYHDSESLGVLMYRINQQASGMGQIVTSIPVVAQNVLTVIGMAYISVRINALLALLALGTTPFVVYSTIYYTDRIEPRLYRVRGLGAINLAIVHEVM